MKYQAKFHSKTATKEQKQIRTSMIPELQSFSVTEV